MVHLFPRLHILSLGLSRFIPLIPRSDGDKIVCSLFRGARERCVGSFVEIYMALFSFETLYTFLSIYIYIYFFLFNYNMYSDSIRL